MIHLKDVAKECRVSVATVSKALNDQADVGKKTKERIRQKAKEMGYFPNASARALKTNRTNSIGILCMDEKRSGLREEYFLRILEVFYEESRKRGYDITLIHHNFEEKGMNYYEHCKYRGVDGVLIGSVDFSDWKVQALLTSEIPSVTVDYIFPGQTAISSGYANGIRQLVEYAAEAGHEKIAYIYGEDSAMTRECVQSFCMTLQEYKIGVCENYLLEGRYADEKRARELTEQLLKQETLPTCIFYSDDRSCLGGISAILKSGMRVPDDISVVGYGGNCFSEILSRRITTVRQNTDKIGKLAATHLIDRIEYPKTAWAEQITVPGLLIKGNTVKRKFVR